MQIPTPQVPDVDEAEYWLRHAVGREALPAMPKPCHDCAVTTGFYLEYAESLARQPPQVVAEASARWFCHNCPGRACKGNLDYQDRHK